ncbi:MAG: SagB family peptide dehydrogenase, partial [Candidatus Hodarchaeales archaeon]
MSKTVLKLKLILVLVIMGVTLILTTVELFPISSDGLTLPAPDLTGHVPLSSAIQDLTITRNLKNKLISTKEISQLLWSFQGITHGPGFRSAPSAGATYPLKIFFLQRSSSSLKEGYYSYNSDQHWLKSISDSFNDTELLLTLSSEDREPFSNVSSIFFILADYDRTTDRYGERGVQYVHLEVGHVLQNFLLQSSALNLDTWVITQFDSEQIKRSLNITLEPLIILPVGQHDDLNHGLLRIKKQNSRTEESSEEMTVEQAIANRKSIRDYIGGKIPLAVLMDILQDSITINYLEGDNSLLDLRLVAGEIEGLSTGMYTFSMDNYALNQYSQEDSRNSLKTVALDQPWVENAQLDLVLSANTTWIYQQSDPIFHQRKMMFNIGMIAQNIYLKCTSHGLGTVVVGAFNDWGVAQLIATPDTHLPFYIIPIGLTPEFGEHPLIFSLPMIEIARSIGLLSFILFYFSLYMTLPVL